METKITNDIIDELFKNERFKEKLNEYIVSNLVVRQDYNFYEGTYDDLSISFAGTPIEIESKSYGC